MSARAAAALLARPLLAAAAVLLLPAVLLAAEPPSAERGRRIYLEGESPSGGEIVALMGDEGIEVPAAAVPCASCHARDGKGQAGGAVTPSDLTWPSLSRPRGAGAGGRTRPAYDERRLKRAIAMGLDPAGNKLNAAMPRFRMSLADMADLVAYLRQLGGEAGPD